MSLGNWYRQKAEQCARMAEEATDPRRCADYKEEQKLWLEIADRIELIERNQARSDPQ